MSGFLSPNYTQTPNDLFDELLPEMGLAELKVVMCVVRNTFGYHRDEVKLSIRTIARATGLTAKSVMEGAKLAEEHGLLERYQDGNKTTLWRAIVSVIPSNTPRITKYHAGVIPSNTLVGVKEKKERGKKGDLLDAILQTASPKEVAEKNATSAFEKAFGFGELPWWTSGSTWDRMRRFVTSVHQRDPSAFSRYVAWRTDGGKYVAMSNKQIRQTPQMFIDTAWPEFEASAIDNGYNPLGLEVGA